MTQEEKHLLLKDLCARLPYGVKVGHFGVTKELLWAIPSSENVMVGYDINDYEDTVIEDIKPYLRPMSSMTEEEEREYNGLLKPLGDFMFEQEEEFKPIQLYKSIPFELYDFFNSHHLDFRGLIPIGIALEAPEDMYQMP